MSETIKAKDYDFCTESIDYYNVNFVQQGWQCPICKKVLAPFMTECPYNHDKKEELILSHTDTSTKGE